MVGSQIPIEDGYLYLLDEQTGYVWEKVQLRCSGQYFTLISFANHWACLPAISFMFGG